MQKAQSPFSTPYSSLLSSQGYCNICYTPYNTNDHQPLLICKQNHCICKTCLKSIINNLRCPFCRENIRLNRIRLNKASLQFIKQKDSVEAKRRYLQITKNERLATANDQQQFIDITELIGEQELELFESQRQQVWIGRLIFLQLFIFQIPLGIYAFINGLFNIKDVCYDEATLQLSISLRDVLLVQGYVECVIALMTAYFSAFYSLRLFQYHSLVSFYRLLLIVNQIKSLLCLIFYYKVFQQGYQNTCSNLFQKYSWTNAAVNSIQIILGGYLIYKYFKRL